MKKLNVGIVIFSNSWGGAEESVHNISSYISRKNLNLFLFVNSFLYKRYRNIKNAQAVDLGKLESFEKFGKIVTLFALCAKLQKEIEKDKIDVLHVFLENSILVVGVMKLPENVRIIISLRGWETRIYLDPKTLEHKIIRFILESHFKKSTTFTSVSHQLIKDVKHKKKILVIPNGVDVNIFRPLKTKKNKNTISYVGRMVPGKGIEELLKVAKKLNRYTFLFGGDGPLAGRINLPNTRYLGFLKREKVAEIFAKSTIGVFASHSEGFSMSGLEVMACGTPIIATHGNFEYIEDGVDGVLIDAGNVAQLENAVKKLMENSRIRMEIGKAARKKALKFSIRSTVSRYYDLYFKLAST